MVDANSSTKKYIKIRRAIYSFNIRRLYIPVKRFVKKTIELTPEAIKQAILSVFQTKQKQPQARAGPSAMRRPTGKLPAPSPLLNALIILVIAVLLIGGYFLFVYFSQQSAPVEEVTREAVTPILSASVINTGYLDYNGKDTVWYALLDLSSVNATKIDIDLIIQQQPIPQNVYILKLPNYQFASNYDRFYEVLKNSLKEKGIYVSELTAEELISLPSTRKIILIVPSGNLPALFVGKEDKNFDLKKFANNGNVLIYIGYKPTDGILYSNLPGPQPVTSEDISSFQLSFGQPKDQPSFFSFRNPLYTVSAVGTESSRPSVTGEPGGYSVKWSGDGFVYFIPTTIDFWWQYAGENSAKELADAVVNARWGSGLSRIKKTIDLNQSNSSVFRQQFIIFSSPFSFKTGDRVSRSYGVLYVQGINKVDNSTKQVGISMPVKFPTRPKGVLSHDAVSLNSVVTNRPLEMTYSLNADSDELKQLFLSVLSSNNSEVLFKQLTVSPVSLKLSNVVYRFDNRLGAGEYVMRITDQDKNVFAQSYLSLLSFSFVPYASDFINGIHVFDVYLSTGEQYTDEIKNLKVYFDGEEAKGFSFKAGKIYVNTSSTTVPGNHVFVFQLGPDNVTVIKPFERPVSMFEKPENIAMMVIAASLFIIGYLIARPEKTYYWIDVPDFPPLQSIAIPIKREKILEMFDTINADLKWKYTPLTIGDLKIGFKKIMFRGKPLIVGDYNLEMVLEKMKEEGLIVQSMDYYAPKRWEKETRKSIYYLAQVRALRDIFVTEGIPFLQFGQRGDADTVISYGGEKVYIHIYESDEVIKKAIQTASVGRGIIVFENEMMMNEFLSRLHAPGKANVIFKLLMDNGKIAVTPISKFMDVLEKKVVFSY
jgi:hypothetical protein